MNKFSDILKKHIHSKDIKVASMAQSLEMDRANFYKLLNGKRMPPSRDFVLKIADYLLLSPMQCQELMEAYHITLIGEDTYYQRQSALHFLTNCFSSQVPYSLMDPSDETAETHSDFIMRRMTRASQQESLGVPKLPDHCMALHGRQQIHQMLSLVCLAAVSSEDALIQIDAQPTWTHLFSMLQALGHLDSHLKIEHLLCLNIGEAPAGYDRNVYNVRCIEKIFPLFGCSCQYSPHFYYDNIDSHFNNMQLFSYAVITNEYVLTCSSDLQQGMILHKTDLVSLYQKNFTQKYNACCTMFHLIHSDLNDYMQITLDSLGTTLDATPCFMLYASDELVQKLLVLPETVSHNASASPPGLFQQIVSYKKKIKHYSEHTATDLLTFSDVGLDYFMETGRIASYPDELYSPVPPAIRLDLLNLLLNVPDQQLPLRLKGSLSRLSPATSIVVNERNGYILMKKNDGQLMYLVLQEKILLQTLYDFLFHLEEEELLYTPDETRAYLKEIIKKYS